MLDETKFILKFLDERDIPLSPNQRRAIDSYTGVAPDEDARAIKVAMRLHLCRAVHGPAVVKAVAYEREEMEELEKNRIKYSNTNTLTGQLICDETTLIHLGYAQHGHNHG